MVKKTIYLSIFFSLMMFSLFFNTTLSYTQNHSDDDLRGLKPKEYTKEQTKKVCKKVIAARPNTSNKTKDINYKFAEGDDAELAFGTPIGFTFWKLQAAKPNDDQEIVENTRIAVRKKNTVEEQTIKTTPVRANSSTEFKDGEHIRFSLELPFTGYVYLLNREQYVDGSFSAPYLIFPDQSDIGKNDRAVAGQLLFLPNQKDSFEIEKFGQNTPEKIAEVFTLLVSPNPLEELTPTKKFEPEAISKTIFEDLVNKWGGKTWKFEQENGVGLSITKAEKFAQVKHSNSLTQDDNWPQTVYHVAHKPGKPLMFNVPVKIGK